MKSHNRHMREVPLDDQCIRFIQYQLEKHKDDIFYGRVRTKDKVITYKKYRYLFPVFHDDRWQRCDDFRIGIQGALEYVSNEFNLGYSGKNYTVHDFRTTLNEEMGDLGISTEDRAYILGHSKDVNEKNYMNQSKKKELSGRKAHASFKKKKLNQNNDPLPPVSAKRPGLKLVVD